MIGFSIWYSHMKTAFTKRLLAGCFSFRFSPVPDLLECVAMIDSFGEEWLDLYRVESNQQRQLTHQGLPAPLYQLDIKFTPPLLSQYYVSLTTKNRPKCLRRYIYHQCLCYTTFAKLLRAVWVYKPLHGLQTTPKRFESRVAIILVITG